MEMTREECMNGFREKDDQSSEAHKHRFTERIMVEFIVDDTGEAKRARHRIWV